MKQARATTVEEARNAKRRAMVVFTPLAAVVGIGVTRIGQGYGLKVNLQTLPSVQTPLPTEVDGVPVRVEVVGLPHKQ